MHNTTALQQGIGILMAILADWTFCTFHNYLQLHKECNALALQTVGLPSPTWYQGPGQKHNLLSFSPKLILPPKWKALKQAELCCDREAARLHLLILMGKEASKCCCKQLAVARQSGQKCGKQMHCMQQMTNVK